MANEWSVMLPFRRLFSPDSSCGPEPPGDCQKPAGNTRQGYRHVGKIGLHICAELDSLDL